VLQVEVPKDQVRLLVAGTVTDMPMGTLQVTLVQAMVQAMKGKDQGMVHIMELVMVLDMLLVKLMQETAKVQVMVKVSLLGLLLGLEKPHMEQDLMEMERVQDTAPDMVLAIL